MPQAYSQPDSPEQAYKHYVRAVAEKARDKTGQPQTRAKEAAFEWLADDIGIQPETVGFMAGLLLYSDSTPHRSFRELRFNEDDPLETFAALVASSLAGDVLGSADPI